MIIFRLFYEFFCVGLFAIGGGLATLPFLYELSEKTGWFTRGDLADMVAISESTPGPMGVNMATFTGYTCAGVLGSISAVLGLILPSIIIIIVVAQFLNKFKESKNVKNVFYGLRPASTGLIAAAGFEVFKITMFNMDKISTAINFANILNYKAVIFGAILFVLIKKYKKHPVVYIAASAIVGVIFKF